MLAVSDDDLIERIYEAAIVPSQWRSVLDMIAVRANALGTGLFLLSGRSDPTAVWSDSLDDLWKGWIAGGWQAKTQRAPRMMALDHAGFVADCDIYAPGEMEQDEAYRGYLRPSGVGYGAGTGIVMPTGDTAVFSLERRHETGAFTRADCMRLDPLRPHLARASLLSVRAGIERAQAMTHSLESLGLPGAVVRASGRLVAANPQFEALMPAVFQDARTRLRLTSSTADALFGDALTGLKATAAYRGVSSIPVPAVSDAAVPLIAHLVPTRGVAQDFFLQSSVVIVVTPVDRASAPAANVLQGLFDLTPTEAKVAQGIVAAQSVQDIAAANGSRPETVRAQIKSVFAKTGVNRQGELVSLLAGKSFKSI